MSVDSFSIPADYKYVIAAYSLFPLVQLYIDNNVIGLRSKAKVPYPKLFADNINTPTTKDSTDKNVITDEDRFNCAQKASMNFTEHIPLFVIASAVAGLEYPKITAGLTVWYAFTRVIYQMGYSTGDPEKRHAELAYLPYAGTVLFGVGCAIKMAFF